MGKSGGHQENPDWDRTPEDKVPIDQTVTIRIKYRTSKVRGKMLSKCPLCHENYPEPELRTHRGQCSGGTPVLDSSTPPASTQRSPKSLSDRLAEAIDHNLPRTVTCKHCHASVKQDHILMRKHLRENHPLVPAKKLSRHFKM